MRCDVTTELKALRLYGMVNAWADLIAQGETSTACGRRGQHVGFQPV